MKTFTKTKNRYVSLGIYAPSKNSETYVKALPGDYVCNKSGHYYYYFGESMSFKNRLVVKKSVFEYYKNLPNISEEILDGNLVYKLTKDTLMVEVKTLAKFIEMCSMRAGNQLVGIDDIMKIYEILSGNPMKKDFMLFDNAGGRNFNVIEGESAKAILEMVKIGNLKESYIYAYVINGKEVINNIPYFMK